MSWVDLKEEIKREIDTSVEALESQLKEKEIEIKYLQDKITKKINTLERMLETSKKRVMGYSPEGSLWSSGYEQGIESCIDILKEL